MLFSTTPYMSELEIIFWKYRITTINITGSMPRMLSGFSHFTLTIVSSICTVHVGAPS